MSDIDLAVTRSRKLEQILERDFGASGRGLHEKTSSVEDRLPEPLVRKLRLVATVRNKVLHEEGPIDDRRRFVDAADDAERELKRLARGRRKPGRRVLLIAIVVLIGLVAFAVLVWRPW
jgi:hypothetical protein